MDLSDVRVRTRRFVVRWIRRSSSWVRSWRTSRSIPSHRAPLAHRAPSHASSHAIGLQTEGASVNIADLKRQSTAELRDLAKQLGSVIAPGIPKHDLLFTVQQRLLDSGETLTGEGVL